MNKIRGAFAALVEQGVIAKRSLVGCTSNEILTVERHFACRLPQEYKDFLSIAGKGAGKLFRGTDIFYPRLLELQSEAGELLAESNLRSPLPNDAVVFCMHQGYELNYFEPKSDDPPVFQFVEGQTEAAVAWPAFSEFILTAIESHRRQWRNLD